MRTVVFDLDGTLADTSGDLIAAANACFERMGKGAPLSRTGDALVAFGGGRAMLRLGFSRLGAAWTEADVDAQYPVLLEAYAGAIAVHSTLYPGAVQAVEALRAAGFATAICTNKPEHLAVMLCDHFGISGLFGALLGADTLPVRKPDPEHYFETVRRAGGDAARSLLIGDTITDRDTARAAGVPIVLVGFGPEGAGVDRLQPDALLHHYDDLPGLVDRLLPA
ncbi:HAD family hydrolase [Pseudorhodobacter sp. E13]|uniref:HAD-IA family hydrolase n=1 Tax=Pseudorhodobacter sp. E13 TaxID=2487931 RepID=UPI000F8EC8A0|nr:HAD-IA family hydrolase [Pseudorhodobacter sp. E13]RUS59471.1 HAD family hydrolase [Pseudorhodobacter sp. E13]